MATNDNFRRALSSAVNAQNLLTAERKTTRYRKGIRVGGGAACAVVRPETLAQFWEALKVCVAHDKIIICQAANTGLTGGSTPDGDSYDREVVIINTMNLDQITLLGQGEQVVANAGSTLFQLENRLEPLGRGPHSVIGSSCIGASVVGGVCNNSGGNLVNRGPAYTEMSLFAKLRDNGELELINHLGIDLGGTPEEMLENLQIGNFGSDSQISSQVMASDSEYQARVREVDANTPARFNADKRRLHDASGCAGKLAVFAVRLDTFAKPSREKVFYIGTNNPEQLTTLRKRILTEFDELPEMGEYMHRSYFDGADKYAKDTFLLISLFGSAFPPKLFAFKAWVDSLLGHIPFLPANFSDRCLQVMGKLWPDHLPKRLRSYRDHYEHHLMIVSSDGVIEDTRKLLESHFASKGPGDYFECTEKEGKAAQLHRFVAGGASARYKVVHSKESGGLMPLDIALPRNCDDWHSILPDEILNQLAAPYQLSHFFCMVFHWDFVVKKGVDPDVLKKQVLALLEERNAKYPAEHNVGHLYKAEPDLAEFYRSLDPTNSFNAGVGGMSKYKYYEPQRSAD
jgi:D-lactate dehydrogenase